MKPNAERATFLGSDAFLARAVARPVTRFLAVEAAGGALLVVAAVVAVVWANSPWSASYESLWSSELSVSVAGHGITEDLRHWINDGLMTLFFFVIGLEIKEELVSGQLRHPRDAAVPVVGALGGMLVPAALFLAFNLGGPGESGWGVPMATDVAFAVGVLALLGSRVPTELKVLLLGLAIIDDVGAILVIALVYSDGVDLGALAVAVLGLGLVVVFRQVRVRYLPVYVVVGSMVWLALFESGVHATIAGVALGLLAPARPFLPEVDADRIAGELSGDEHVTAGEVRDISFRLRESVPVTERLQDLLHPWTSYLIVPLFALANAGVPISASGLSDAATSPVTAGVVVGLVVGKLLGVSGAILLAVRLGIGRLPETVTVRHVLGLAAVAGIGFTVSLFITALAFDDPALTDQAKIGVLAASVLAALIGIAILRGARAAVISTPDLSDVPPG
jgi:NhaA family Na+:H+ antiporter